jgi:uncharacterized membrane protein YfcA
VPIFVYLLGYPVKPAIAMSLGVVGTTSLAGAVAHWRAGNVNLRAVASFAPFAMLGALAGTRLATLVSETLQLMLFAALMLAAAVRMLGPTRAGDGSARRLGLLQLGPLGAVVGLLTGLVGVGGGFLIVPALALVGGLPMSQAIGTSLAVIALNALTGFAGYLGRVPMDWPLMGGFTALAVLGAAAGTRLGRGMPAAALRRGFGLLLLVLAVFILVRGRPMPREDRAGRTVETGKTIETDGMGDAIQSHGGGAR